MSSSAPPMSSIYPRDEVKVGFENTLVCYIAGFYPPRLTVRWTKNNKHVTQGVSNSQLRVNVNDFTFTMFSTLKFTPQKGDIYTCTVGHSALERPMTREFGKVFHCILCKSLVFFKYVLFLIIYVSTSSL